MCPQCLQTCVQRNRVVSVFDLFQKKSQLCDVDTHVHMLHVLAIGHQETRTTLQYVPTVPTNLCSEDQGRVCLWSLQNDIPISRCWHTRAHVARTCNMTSRDTKHITKCAHRAYKHVFRGSESCLSYVRFQNLSLMKMIDTHVHMFKYLKYKVN